MDQSEECPVWERIRIHDTTHPDVCWKPETRGWQVTRESLVTPEDYDLRIHTGWLRLDEPARGRAGRPLYRSRRRLGQAPRRGANAAPYGRPIQ